MLALKKGNYHNNPETKKIFGFWIYLMSDCILFAALFATYSVLSYNSHISNILIKDIFNITFVLLETILLLCSSFTYSMVIITLHEHNKNKSNTWLILTFILGACFIYMELYEFYHLIKQGYGPNKNAFFSSFFTLIATHGIHVIVGLIWITTMTIQIFYQGFTIANKTRLQCLSLFWHFLDLVWICVFSTIYLIGVL